jgi:predicted PurR-regulated permease PerM
MLAHGIVGLFVGPIILAVAWQLVVAWIREERIETAPPVVDHSTVRAVES